MPLVVDASVVVKWVFPGNDGEANIQQAMAVFQSVRAGKTQLLQPPHWLAEVSAVCVRLDARIAQDAIRFFHAMHVRVADSPEIYSRACKLAQRLDHHLFDTLYHAVALTIPETLLVTADHRYFRKAKKYGAILSLAEFSA